MDSRNWQGLMVYTLTLGIDKYSWYRNGLIVLTRSHGIAMDSWYWLGLTHIREGRVLPICWIFTKSAHWANSFIESPCLSVYLCVCGGHRKTPTSWCHGELSLRNIFLILAYDPTIFFVLKWDFFYPHKKNWDPPHKKIHLPTPPKKNFNQKIKI